MNQIANPFSDAACVTRLRRAGLRPTRQRVALTRLIYDRGDWHFSAEELHAEARAGAVDVSLATIYNTLHQFTEAGLLRPLNIEGSKTYFDTNVSNHHHFFIDGENRIIDIEADPVLVGTLPPAPDGMEITHVDVIIRLRRKRS